jgi:hypothetical protein
MSDSYTSWQKLPVGFLKMKFRGWCQYATETQRLIVELAERQKFQCAFCDQNHTLEIEHDHEPDHGPGHFYTVYNIRGLVCRGCNWHLMIYENDKRGEDRGFENVYSNVNDYEYEAYIYAYERRVSPLVEAQREKRLGTLNYIPRRSPAEIRRLERVARGLSLAVVLRRDQGQKIRTCSDSEALHQNARSVRDVRCDRA